MGLYTGLRLSEVRGLRWEHIDDGKSCYRIGSTKSGRALELPLTPQVEAVLARRHEAAGAEGGWVFPGSRPHAPYAGAAGWYARISARAGTPFWFHACRHCFITVAIRDLLLGESVVKRLVNHAPSRDVTAGYAAPWTLEELRGYAGRIAAHIEALAFASPGQERNG